MNTRIIAKLDVKPPYVVKPVHFEGLRKVGEPAHLAKKYFDQGADELFYIDIVSSLYQRNILSSDIIKTASELFIPFAVGGGVKTVDDFSNLLHMGADKVVINSFAVQNNPNIINIAAERGAGEILLQSVDHDGRRRGFDIDLATRVVNSVDIPVVVASGAGSLEDISKLIKVANPSGIALASLLHYDQLTIKDIRNYLRNEGLMT